MRPFRVRSGWAVATSALLWSCGPATDESEPATSNESITPVGESLTVPSLIAQFYAPAGDRPTTRHVQVDGMDAAVLPNGRLVTPAGVEIGVTAPKPNGIALSPDGKTLATTNNGVGPFSATLIRGFSDPTPSVTRVNVDATFMGITFSPDGTHFYMSGGENGNVWVGDVAANAIVGSVNLNGSTHPLGAPLAVNSPVPNRFKGTFPGNLALSADGKFLYIVDQGGFAVHVIDTTKLSLGADSAGQVLEPNNFGAVIGKIPAGRYPYGISLSQDATRLYVTNVAVFQYTHLLPQSPTGDSNVDYPLCYPGAGYPDETEQDTTLLIKPVDARALPTTLRDPDGIQCGYVKSPISYTVPGLGSPNAPEASSVYVFDVTNPSAASRLAIVKPGFSVGDTDHGVAAYGGSHPNSVAVGRDAIYVANGNDDSISILDPVTFENRGDVSLAILFGFDARLRGVQPVALRLSPDERTLYVAEAGLNSVGVLRVRRNGLSLEGLIPTGWWPSALEVSADGGTLFVANANGRGAGPDNDMPPDNLGSPKSSTMGSVSVIPVPGARELARMTRRVLSNNGFVLTPPPIDPTNPVPHFVGVPSRQIKHVIFINKENATHDLMLGDITTTRGGQPVDGEPRYSLGQAASPNHHELALRFAFSDNFFLEPSVSSDGHRWLNNNYTTEFEETHWPASYGGRRNDAGNDPAVITGFPGRIGFTDANASPEPNDLNEFGGIFAHLHRNGRSFVNFGNGYEFAILDEDGATEPTGVREHVNVPMEKVLRDNSDHLFPEFNTHIPDAILPEDPSRFSRFGRFKQVFESNYVDRRRGRCMLPQYVDLYYPNDHGGGARDINPEGPDWSFKRFVQDNDAALGMTIELLSHSPCWTDTVVFVVEDDTQNGFDHVDGHRSLFLAVSPWVKHEYVSKAHASLSSIFKTVDLLLGIPPLNQYDLAASDLSDIFTSKPDFTPYDFVPVEYEGTPNAMWTALSASVDFSSPDVSELALREAILRSEGLPRPE
jgi:DNA-binding beta-propeller fold protein YncE